MTARMGGAWLVALWAAANRHTWLRRTPRARTNPTPQAQVEPMEMEEEVHRDWDDLIYEEITLMVGTDDHLLEGQGGNNNRA